MGSGKLQGISLYIIILSMAFFAITLNAATISGTLTGFDGALINHGFVQLYSAQGDSSDNEPGGPGEHGFSEFDCFTNQNGVFNIADLPQGSYRLKADAIGYFPGFLSDPNTGEVQVIEVDADDQEVEGLIVVLDANPYELYHASISGRVFGSGNVPLQGISVGIVNSAYPDSLLPGHFSVTDWDGEYHIFGLPSGTYQTVVYNAQTMEPLEYSNSVTVVDWQDVHNVNIILDITIYTVSGTVINSEGQPLHHGLVTLMSDTATEPDGCPYTWASAPIHNNGTYIIPSVLPGNYKVKVWTNDAPPIYYPSVLNIDNAEIISVVDANVNNINITIPNLMFQISGVVKDQVNHQPLAGIKVKADNLGFIHYPHHDSLDFPGFTTTTDANGSYVLNVPLGEYCVLALDEQHVYKTQFFDHVSQPFVATVLYADHNIENIDFDLLLTNSVNFSVSGVVLEDDLPIDYPVMVVAVSSDEDWEESVITDQLGHYTIGDLPIGTYYIIACSPYTPPTYYSEAINWEDAQLISVSTDVSGINFNLTSSSQTGPYGLNGQVFDSEDSPMSNAIVVINDLENNTIGFARTDESGNYSIANMPSQDYTVLATKLGHNTTTQQMDLNENQVMDFVLTNVVGNEEIVQNVPRKASLRNYPNPFNPSTTIAFSIPKDSKVNVEIFNIKGQKIKTLLVGELAAGQHLLNWNSEDANGKKVASGVYFIKAKGNDFEVVRKLSLLK